jgi:trans-2-enoyl-CoA reductase
MRAITGIPAWNINGDAFTEAVKADTLERIKTDLGQVDFVVYGIAAPRRLDPETGEIYSSAIKPIGRPFTGRGIDFLTGRLVGMTTAAATEEEVAHTIKVMDRLYRDFLFSGREIPLDNEGRVRLDDGEMRSDVQRDVAQAWKAVTPGNLAQYADLQGFREEFLSRRGFGMPGIDYSRPVDPTIIEI